MRGTLSVGIVVAALAAVSSQAWATPPCQVSGGEVPVPFGGVNQHVELADGESYLLVGALVDTNVNGQSSLFFQVDLDELPWLATAARKAFPFYLVQSGTGALLDASSRYWSQYLGERVKLSVRAHVTGLANGRVVVSVEPIEAPTEAPASCSKGRHRKH